VTTTLTYSMSTTKTKRLPRSFYDRPTVDVAHDLLGKSIVFRSEEGILSARIVEVEAYVGQDDPACHAARGRTMRNQIMFGKPGFSYIYFIYGMYYCLNFVTEREGFGAAVLIRAAEPKQGLEIMRRNSPGEQRKGKILSGPGKLCRSFGLTRDHNGLDLTGRNLFVESRGEAEPKIKSAARIGIKTGTNRLWRFYDADSSAVSKR